MGLTQLYINRNAFGMKFNATGNSTIGSRLGVPGKRSQRPVLLFSLKLILQLTTPSDGGESLRTRAKGRVRREAGWRSSRRRVGFVSYQAVSLPADEIPSCCLTAGTLENPSDHPFGRKKKA